MASTETNHVTAGSESESTVLRLIGLVEPLLGWSFGRLGRTAGHNRFPKQCMWHCLNGSAEALQEKGCAWLKAMAEGESVPRTPPGNRCEKLFQIHVHSGPESADGRRVFALRDTDTPAATQPDFSPELAMHHWDVLQEKVNHVAAELEAREEENVRLVEEVLQSYEQLNILFDVTKASITMNQAEEVFDFALKGLSSSLRAEFACFLNSDGSFVRTISEFEQQQEQYRNYRNLIAGDAGQTIARGATSQGTGTMIVSDSGLIAGQIVSKSLLVVPLCSGAEVLGATLFGRPASDPFRTGDQSMAEAVMGQVAHTAHKMRLFQDLHQMSVDVVSAMVNAIDAKDNYTSGHSERVAKWSVLIGKEFDLPEEELQRLAWGGRLHDVGKIGIRDDVLGKKGKLTFEEFEHIKEHPVISYEVLKPIHRLAPILDGVRHHHEGWDGSGYPDGLAGENIPFTARIIQIADVFDALTTLRSYRGAFSMEKAVEIMKADAGKRLDPNLVEVFVKLLERIPQERPDLLAHICKDADQAEEPVKGREP